MANRLLKPTPYGNLFITSTEGDGNCFYHAYLQSVEDEIYSKYTPEQRKRRVMVIREHLQKMLTQEDVFYLNDPVSFDSLKQEIDKYLVGNNMKPVDYMGSNFSLGGYVEFLEKAFPGIDTKPEFIKHIQRTMDAYGNQIATYLKTDGTWMTDTFIPYFSKKLQVDIEFISSTDNKPVQLSVRNGFPAVILMYHTGGHFESMGIQTDKEVIRVFTPEAIDLLHNEL